jgi:hypothetical protein
MTGILASFLIVIGYFWLNLPSIPVSIRAFLFFGLLLFTLAYGSFLIYLKELDKKPIIGVLIFEKWFLIASS